MNDEKMAQYAAKMADITQFMQNGQFVEAKRELLKIKQDTESDPDAHADLRSDICDKLYQIAWINHDIENAYKYAEEAIALHSDNDVKVQMYGKIAMNALQIEQLDDASAFVEKGITLLSATTPTSWYLYQIRGKIQLHKGDLSKALADFTQSASEADRLHMPHGEIATTICIAETLFKQGMANSALMEIIRMEHYARKTTQLQQYLRVLIKKAQFLYRMGRAEEAKQVILTIPDFND